jgi:hypothetical protein
LKQEVDWLDDVSLFVADSGFRERDCLAVQEGCFCDIRQSTREQPSYFFDFLTAGHRTGEISTSP